MTGAPASTDARRQEFFRAEAATASERILVLETELRIARETLSAFREIVATVDRTTVVVGDLVTRNQRTIEFLDRLESRASKSEAKLEVVCSRCDYIEKAVYTAAGIFAASLSGLAVFIVQT